MIGPILLAGGLSGCDSSDFSPATPAAPAAPPQILPQAPQSCTFRMSELEYSDRVAWFTYDVRWFPPQDSGSAPIYQYEVGVYRAASRGYLEDDNSYVIEDVRELPTAYKTVRANDSATTDDLHEVEDIVSFPICEFIAANEDLLFGAEVSSVSSVGKSTPFTCVHAQELWEAIVLPVSASESWNDYYSSRCNPRAAHRNPEGRTGALSPPEPLLLKPLTK